MPSNTELNAGTGGDVITTKQRTHDGDTTLCQSVSLAGVTGTEDSYTFVDIQEGNGTETGSLRVTIASDSTGQVALAAGSATVGEVTIGAATTAAGDLAKAEDAAHSSGDVGVMGLAVRNDTLAALAGADGDYAPHQVDANGAGYTRLAEKVSTVNSSTATLGIDAVFTGTGEDISQYAAINIMVFADEDSATDGLSLQWSSDNSNWDESETHTITASTTLVVQAMGEGNYFRIVYTNGGTGQSAFRLHVVYKVIPSLGEVTHLDVTITDSADAQLTRSILTGKTPGGTYSNIGITTGGNLNVSVEEADTSASGLAKAEDAVHSSGDVGVMALAVRNDTLAALAGADGDYAPVQVNDLGAAWTILAPNKVDSNNTTTSTLANDAIYTGTGTDVLGYAAVSIQIDSSHDSATDGMTFQFSPDNTNWDSVHLHSYTAADGGRNFQFAAHAQYFRFVYTNGGTTQTHFRVQTILHRNSPITTIHRLSDNTDPDRSATIHKSVTIAQAAGSGDFVPVQATTSGNFKQSLEEIDASLLGGGVEAGALLVTIASDSTGVLSIDDNGGSITVDNAGTFVIQEDGAALTALQLIDDPIFADDAAFTLTSSKVFMAGAIRDDSLTTLTAVEGDAVPLRVGSTGALHVTGGGGGTEYTEDVATANPIVGTATLVERDDALSAVTPIEGDWIGLRGSAEGALWVQDFNSDAILADTASMDTNLGTVAGAVSGTEMQVDVVASLPAGTNNIGDVDIISLPASTNTIEVVGDVAHDVAAAGNPVLIAARATASVEGITEVAEADSTFLSADLSGALITRAACAHAELVSFYVANTDGAEDAVTSLDDGGAAIYNFITSVTIHNSHASTNGFVTLLDGSGGSIFWAFPAPATGGTTHNFDPPLRQPTISTALYVDVSAAITTMYISINGYQGNG